MIKLHSTEMLDWADPKDFDLDNYSNGSLIGCLLEVDFDCPDELRDYQR